VNVPAATVSVVVDPSGHCASQDWAVFMYLPIGFLGLVGGKFGPPPRPPVSFGPGGMGGNGGLLDPS